MLSFLFVPVNLSIPRSKDRGLLRLILSGASFPALSFGSAQDGTSLAYVRDEH